MSTTTLLEPVRFFILLALAKGPMHGLAIQSEIMGDTLGVYIRASTLYDALKGMVRDGLLETEEITYRKTYWLTEKGLRKLQNESKMYAHAARICRQRCA